MCMHKELVLPVKKQDVCLTEMSSLHVVVVSKMKMVDKTIILTNKVCTSAHSEPSL
jgi:hypothetical protein